MEYQYVKIEEEKLFKIPMEMDELPGFYIVNESLNHFRFKEIFPWKLTIRLNPNEMDENQLPTEKEMILIEGYRKNLESKFNNEEKPNALFVADLCVNRECDMIWRIHNPDAIDDILKEEIKIKPPKFEFGYFMEHDIKWLEVEALIEL